MAELFRYIQQAFVVPSVRPAIDVGRRSDLQDRLRGAISQGLPADRLRSIADGFLSDHFGSPLADPTRMGKQLLFVSEQIAARVHRTHGIDQLISQVFGSDASELVGSTSFLADKALLDDALVCVKITTAFDRVNAHDLVGMRRAIAFIEDFAAGKVTGDDPKAIAENFRRPIRVPSEFVKSLPSTTDQPHTPPAADPANEAGVRQRAALLAEQQHLQTAYDSIMNLPPDQFELKPVRVTADRQPDRRVAGGHLGGGDVSGGVESGGVEAGSGGNAIAATPTFLAVPTAALERLGGDVRKTLEAANIDVVNEPVANAIAAIKKRWQDVSEQLAPYQAPAPVPVYRVGAHVFAVLDSARTSARAKEGL